jgi:hypothetical protein
LAAEVKIYLDKYILCMIIWVKFKGDDGEDVGEALVREPAVGASRASVDRYL